MQVKISWRSLVFVLVVLAHALALIWLNRDAHPTAHDDDHAMRIEFIDAPILVPTILAKPVIPAKSQRTHRAMSVPHAALQWVIPAKAAPTPVVPEPEARKSLYGPDGRLRLPDGLMDQLDHQFGDKRSFDFQQPKLDDAATLFYRPQALSYEPTRFEKYWKPDQDLLTDLLTRAVEKTTKEIRIPIPGDPKSHLVCKISLLAMGGGCGIETNGSDYTGPKDDPNTLSPEEARQCQAWWDKIISTKTQDEWRATRKIYELECRKPLEKPQR